MRRIGNVVKSEYLLVMVDDSTKTGMWLLWKFLQSQQLSKFEKKKKKKLNNHFLNSHKNEEKIGDLRGNVMKYFY